MKKIVTIAFLAALSLTGACSKEFRQPQLPVEQDEGVALTVAPEVLAGDLDNLEAEFNIVDLNLFFVPVGSNTVSYKYVQQPFASVDNSIEDIKRVVLPLQPGTLPPMDVHIIANCSDVATLNAVQTVDDIRAVMAPAATAAAGLTTAQGLPMYGMLAGADLNTSTPASPLRVPLTRACAKLRVTLTFTDPTWVGTNNSFVLENAPPYTYYVPGQIPTGLQLINYPQTILTTQSATQSQSIIYVYEAATSPQLHLYTTINGTLKNYVAKNQFPLPVRNYLYDIELQVLKPPPARSGAGTDGDTRKEPEFIMNVESTPWR